MRKMKVALTFGAMALLVYGCSDDGGSETAKNDSGTLADGSATPQ